MFDPQATLSALAQSGGDFSLWGFVLNVILPTGTLAAVVAMVFKLGGLNEKFAAAIGDIKSLKNDVKSTNLRLSTIKDYVIELQRFLKDKFLSENTDFTSLVGKLGEANSPIVLKAEYKDYITDVGLDKQIQSNRQLFEWLKNKKPTTGLDAQDLLRNLVFSDKISEFININAFKQNAYEKGQTSETALAILAIYLFEVLIPRLELREKNERS